MEGCRYDTVAVVLERPEHLDLRRLSLPEPQADDVVVNVEWSGISTGTERLLWTGQMPPFPGMGYPLVPGYETVGRIIDAGPQAIGRIGERVFVPGARCYGEVRPLFGGAASRLVVPAARATAFDDEVGEQGVLFALAATAYHAMVAPAGRAPDLIVGHGVLGRLLARLTIATGAPPPVVWETEARRRSGAFGYEVVDPQADSERRYHSIYDVSGSADILDTLIAKLQPSGEIVLAGFYHGRPSFAFAPAFMREARFRVAAEWREADLLAVRDLVQTGRLSLDGLITTRRPAEGAADAYATAFTDPDCLKLILDWSNVS
ncbi:MAG: chlorophyll synthesis pathway protein BchC [Hyphomicrobiaceae bacterium]